MLNRNLIILFCAQSLALTAAPAVVLLGGLVGSQLAPNPAWTTLPVALSIVGTAIGTVPAALLMQRLGRRAGFSLAAITSALAAGTAAAGVFIGSFWLFTAALFVIGFTIAFVQQYRFAAAESVPLEQAGRAISLLMLSGIVAAWLGPEVAQRGANLFALPTYTGSFLGISVLLFSAAAVLRGFKNIPVAATTEETSPQPLASLISPRLLLAIACYPRRCFT